MRVPLLGSQSTSRIALRSIRLRTPINEMAGTSPAMTQSYDTKRRVPQNDTPIAERTLRPACLCSSLSSLTSGVATERRRCIVIAVTA